MTRRRPALLAAALGVALAAPLAAPAGAAPAAPGRPAVAHPAAPSVAIGSARRHDRVGPVRRDYPVVQKVTGLSPTAARRAAAALQRAVAAAAGTGDPGDPSTGGELSVSLLVHEQDRRYATVLVQRYRYAAGAAHGSTTYAAVVLDRATGLPVTLQRLFGSHLGAALRVLARESRRLLPTALGPVYAADDVSVAATPTGLGTLVPRPQGVEVLFGQYQVGAYALGTPSVLVPWSALRGLVAAPLPQADAPLPPYTGGQPDDLYGDRAAVARAVRASSDPLLAGRAPGSYRLVDGRVAAFVDPGDGSAPPPGPLTAYQLVPASGDVLTVVARLAPDSYTSHRATVVAVGTGRLCAPELESDPAFPELQMGC